MRGLLLLLCLFATGCGPREVERPPVAAEPSPDVPRLTGFTRPVRLQATSHALPEGAPSVVLHAPNGLPASGAPVVIYLHGWDSCVGALVATAQAACVPGGQPRPGGGLIALHEGVEAALVVVQLAYDTQSSSAGAFADPRFAEAWWEEVQGALAAEGLTPSDRLIGVAHSGGYRALEALLASDLPFRDAVFLDALYGGAEAVADWAVAAPGRRVVSVHTSHDGTTSQSRQLAHRVGDALGEDAVVRDPADPEAALGVRTVVALHTETPHGAVPAEHYRSLVRALLATD